MGRGGGEQIAGQGAVDGAEPGYGAGGVAAAEAGVEGDGQGDPGGDRRGRFWARTRSGGHRRRDGLGCGGRVAVKEGSQVGVGAERFQGPGQAGIAQGGRAGG
ncbi:MAG TPA: hypothetical protein VH089_10805, partial [Streptosporangiaceae bacterium]|nr:hypothetical protein [Streptosporangiaceae bacterium]